MDEFWDLQKSYLQHHSPSSLIWKPICADRGGEHLIFIWETVHVQHHHYQKEHFIHNYFPRLRCTKLPATSLSLMSPAQITLDFTNELSAKVLKQIRAFALRQLFPFSASF